MGAATCAEVTPSSERLQRARERRSRRLAACGILLALAGLGPRPAAAHPLGNFSISQYAGIRVERDAIQLRYVLDMAEIPTFQELQEAPLVPEADHPGLAEYLTRRSEALAEGLRLELDGRRLALRRESTRDAAPVLARTEPPRPPASGAPIGERPARASRSVAITAPAPSLGSAPPPAAPVTSPDLPRLRANAQGTPRTAFTELMAMRELGLGIILFAMVVAAGLGAFHALEPGHGKTVVAAYLVGARGTAWHAVVLGLIVTVSHTAGVYLLGAVTLYASRYIVPERLYPWLGAASGLTIAALGVVLFLRRYAGERHPRRHDHEAHVEEGGPHRHHGAHAHHHSADGPVSLRALLALGITGGIVPCPAALVVLLSAVALRRVGFGLLLIVAFSAGLAAVLIGIGFLMVSARRFMARFQGEGPLITRWLPLTSAAVIALSGVVIAVQALASAGILDLRL
jgi:ABC-type nickel/cobalt efflux system permease component RcnA